MGEGASSSCHNWAMLDNNPDRSISVDAWSSVLMMSHIFNCRYKTILVWYKLNVLLTQTYMSNSRFCNAFEEELNNHRVRSNVTTIPVPYPPCFVSGDEVFPIIRTTGLIYVGMKAKLLAIIQLVHTCRMAMPCVDAQVFQRWHVNMIGISEISIQRFTILWLSHFQLS